MSEQEVARAAVVDGPGHAPSSEVPDGRRSRRNLFSGSVGRNIGLVVALVALCIVGYVTAGRTSRTSTTS